MSILGHTQLAYTNRRVCIGTPGRLTYDGGTLNRIINNFGVHDSAGLFDHFKNKRVIVKVSLYVYLIIYRFKK